MKDEVQEIIELYKNDDIEYYNLVSDLGYDKLLDYITNLQEENKRYKKIFEGKERFSKIMPDDIDFIVMSKTDYDRQVDDIELVALELRSRIDKAIEYIHNHQLVFELSSKKQIQYWFDMFYKDLLNILNGDDKE